MVSYVDDGSKNGIVWGDHSSPLVFSTEKPTEVTIHALCLSLKQGHFDLGTFKYYVSVQ